MWISEKSTKITDADSSDDVPQNEIGKAILYQTNEQELPLSTITSRKHPSPADVRLFQPNHLPKKCQTLSALHDDLENL